MGQIQIQIQIQIQTAWTAPVPRACSAISRTGSRGATSGRTSGRSRQTSTRTSGTGTQGGGREPWAASRPRNSGSLSEQLLNRYYRLQEMGRSHRSPAQQAEPRVLLSAQARLCFCVRYAQVRVWYLPLPTIQLLRVRALPRSGHRSCRCASRPSRGPSS